MDKIQQLLLDSGLFPAAGVLPASEVPCDISVRDACNVNACGNYGKCWTCPPLVGDAQVLIRQLHAFQTAVVFSKVYDLEDSYDYEGMVQANLDFDALTLAARDHLRRSFPEVEFLILGAGGCRKCKPCAAVSGDPCRFPDEAIASLESYCVQVSQLCGRCSMAYLNGPGTVTYFGAVFYH